MQRAARPPPLRRRPSSAARSSPSFLRSVVDVHRVAEARDDLVALVACLPLPGHERAAADARLLQLAADELAAGAGETVAEHDGQQRLELEVGREVAGMRRLETREEAAHADPFRLGVALVAR